MSSKVIRCTSCGNLSRTEYSCGCYWCLECCDACPCNYVSCYGSPAFGCDRPRRGGGRMNDDVPYDVEVASEDGCCGSRWENHRFPTLPVRKMLVQVEW